MQIQHESLIDEEISETERPEVSRRRGPVAVVLGCAVLVLAGFACGRASSSSLTLRGFNQRNVIAELGAPGSRPEFETLYNQVTSGMTLGQKAAANTQIVGTTSAIPNQKLLNEWYTAGTAADKKWAQTLMADALVPTATKNEPAPASTISSYSVFGDLYSQETAGKPWTEITKIDTLVREVTAPVGSTAAVQQLNLWYHHHATADQKKDFDDDAVAHVKQGESAR